MLYFVLLFQEAWPFKEELGLDLPAQIGAVQNTSTPTNNVNIIVAVREKNSDQY